MTSFSWPGNVRELENTLTQAAINTRGEVILDELVRPLLGKNPVPGPSGRDPVTREQSLKDVEKEYILEILQRTHWHLGQACALLGISRPTLRSKLREYALAPRHSPTP